MDAGRFYRRKKELTENQLNDLRVRSTTNSLGTQKTSNELRHTHL